MKESAFQTEPRASESLVRHTSTAPADKAKVTISDGKGADEEKPKKSSLCRTVEGCREELQNQVGPGGRSCRTRWGPGGRSCRAGWGPVGGAAELGGARWEELQSRVGPGGRSCRAGWALVVHSTGAERGAWHSALLPIPPVVILSSKVTDIHHVNSSRVCGQSLLHRDSVAEDVWGFV